jgi:hypothetical protein
MDGALFTATDSRIMAGEFAVVSNIVYYVVREEFGV